MSAVLTRLGWVEVSTLDEVVAELGIDEAEE